MCFVILTSVWQSSVGDAALSSNNNTSDPVTFSWEIYNVSIDPSQLKQLKMFNQHLENKSNGIRHWNSYIFRSFPTPQLTFSQISTHFQNRVFCPVLAMSDVRQMLRTLIPRKWLIFFTPQQKYQQSYHLFIPRPSVIFIYQQRGSKSLHLNQLIKQENTVYWWKINRWSPCSRTPSQME